jgi:hydrogenase maturation protein HypF
VYRIATEELLVGHVGNDPTGVFIEAQGELTRLQEFERRLCGELPAMAKITALEHDDIAVVDESGFVIRKSVFGGRQVAEISPDIATCEDCAREMRAPSDRRHLYPFINCTNCGPRYSIVQDIPYDRPRTTMSKFPMCPDCLREYEDPTDRRFHAQPNACPVCGPRVWFAGAEGVEVSGEAIPLAVSALVDGQIVAVKGLGGFHLACRADVEETVAELRRRKGREAKPFALMSTDLAEVERLVELDEVSRVEIVSWRRPIVLASRHSGIHVCDSVAPDVSSLGVMLPYTPVHQLLLDELRRHDVTTLVMTSANPSDEPLCADNREAIERLRGIADGFLLHDRDIERRVDDSVVVAVRDPEDTVVPLRRARGFVPEPLVVPLGADEAVLAVGGELKSTVCVLDGARAVLSEHLGELSNPAAYRNFVATVDSFKELLSVDPRVVAYDMHPSYRSTVYAQSLGLRSTAVQHHHAHAVSCMAENGVTGKTVAVVCDGTGYGTDGAIWGCEVLVADESGFERVAHLDYYRLIGGDAAAIDTWRPAASLVYDAFGDAMPDRLRAAFDRAPADAISLLRGRLASGAGTPTSSLGRLFDAVAFLLGVCDRNRYEAEAAMRLESCASLERCPSCEPLRFEYEAYDDGPARIDFRPAVRAIAGGLAASRTAGELADAFHEGIAATLADAAKRAGDAHGVRDVVLSGGCFANRILLARLSARAQNLGLTVHFHRAVPTGDGCVSLGQAVCAAARLRKGEL